MGITIHTADTIPMNEGKLYIARFVRLRSRSRGQIQWTQSARTRFRKKKICFWGERKETGADTANSQLPPMVRGMR